MADQGSRVCVHMPDGERYYLLIFPYADEDRVMVKFPYENRPEKEKEREVLEYVLQIVDQSMGPLIQDHDEEVEEIHHNHEVFIDSLHEVFKKTCQECVND